MKELYHQLIWRQELRRIRRWNRQWISWAEAHERRVNR